MAHHYVAIWICLMLRILCFRTLCYGHYVMDTMFSDTMFSDTLCFRTHCVFRLSLYLTLVCRCRYWTRASCTLVRTWTWICSVSGYRCSTTPDTRTPFPTLLLQRPSNHPSSHLLPSLVHRRDKLPLPRHVLDMM